MCWTNNPFVWDLDLYCSKHNHPVPGFEGVKCGLVDGKQHSYPCTRLHGIVFQKTIISLLVRFFLLAPVLRVLTLYSVELLLLLLLSLSLSSSIFEFVYNESEMWVAAHLASYQILCCYLRWIGDVELELRRVTKSKVKVADIWNKARKI